MTFTQEEHCKTFWSGYKQRWHRRFDELEEERHRFVMKN